MNQQKVYIILNLAWPMFFDYIKSFFAFCNFYPQFIQNFSKLVNSHTSPLKKINVKG